MLACVAKIEVPDWADIVKTGTFKELCPQDPDWYFVRAGTNKQHTCYWIRLSLSTRPLPSPLHTASILWTRSSPLRRLAASRCSTVLSSRGPLLSVCSGVFPLWCLSI